MATDTDGRSASAPLAAPTTSAIPQGMHSTDDIGSTTDVRSGITFSTLPTAAGAAPSFFANPFMTPFMPQQPSSSVVAHQHQQQQTDHNEATAEYRINPLPSENYFLQSVHYQEMMQQYIQSLMAAASTLPPSSSIPADLHNQCFDGTIENVLSSATMQPLHDDHQQNESIPNKKVDEQQLNICHNGDYNDTLSLTTPQQQSSSANHSDSNKKQEDMSSSTSSSSSNIIDQNAHHQTECIANNHSNSINNPIETSTHLRSSIATQPLRENCTSSDARETIERREEILLETKVEANEVVSDKVDESRNDEENIDGRVEDADVEACSSGEVLKNVRDCGTDKDVTEPAVAADKCDEDLNEARNEMEQEEGRLLNTAHCLSVDKMGSLSLSAANKSLSKDEDTRCSVSNRNADEASKRQSQAQQLLQQQTASSLSQAHSDCGTSVLIKKQMNEIDKEINRRIQNKNIKKAALPFGISDPSVAVESSMRQKPTLNSSYCLSSSSSFPNQLQCNQQSIFHNHFPQQNQQHLSFHQQPPGSIPTAPPCFPTPYFPAFFSATANQQPTAVTPQLAAALLQQFQQQSQQMALFPLPAAAAAAAAAAAFQLNNNESTSSSKQSPPQRHDNQLHSNDNSTTTSHRSNNQQTILPPPHTNPNNTSSNHSFITLAPSQHSSSSKRAQPATTSESSSSSSVAVKSHTDHQPQKTTQHNWPDDSGWNEIEKRHNSATTTKRCETSDDSEPVWVMRDSYLKRMQREGRNNENLSEPQLSAEKIDNTRDETVDETDRLLTNNDHGDNEQRTKKASKKEVIVHEPAVLIEGVLFRARYLGSTQLICEGRPTKTSRMMQAQEAVARVKAPAGEIQPSTDIDLFISTEKIMVLNTDLQRISETDVRQDILMDHALRTISYIADIGDLVVLMARRMSQSASEEECSSESLEGTRRAPRVICHVFESEEASFIAQSIGQAFQVAYVEFLRANGIDDPSYLREIDYQEVLNSQEMMGEELEMFARKETQKDIVVPKKAGEPLGVVVVESGWGSMLPTVVIANLQPNGAASRCNQLNIGDQIIAINGISLVGLPLASAQQNIKAARSSTAVKLTVVSTPPVVEVRIKRPDTKYQLGFSVQNGVICSLLRGGIAERGGIRVGHRIIEINSQSVVAVAHEKIVNMLATAIGEIHMKTMPTSMFRLLTGQEVPNYI